MKKLRMIFVRLLLLVLPVLAVEALLRVLPVGRVTYRGDVARWEYETMTWLDPKTGSALNPDVDIHLDMTGAERVKIVNHIQTLPVPGSPRYGMRDDGYASGAQRCFVAMGDSFTWGNCVERDEIWCEIIEQQNPGTDVLNLGFATCLAKAADQYSLFRDRLPPHQAVIYAMWLGNEFADNDGYDTARKSFSTMQKQHEAEVRTMWWKAHSKLVSLALNASAIRAFKAGKPNSTTYQPEKAGLWDTKHGQFNLYPANPILLRYCETNSTDERIEHGLDVLDRSLATFKKLAGERRAVVVLFPFKAQLFPELVNAEGRSFDLERPNRIVRELCQKHGVTCLDLTAALKAQREEKLFWDVDEHFTPAGQKAAALETEKQLRSAGIL